jgi:hypothetical protein
MFQNILSFFLYHIPVSWDCNIELHLCSFFIIAYYNVWLVTGDGPSVGTGWFHSIIIMIIHRTLILPVILYGCETWSLTLREERRLGLFQNRVMRRIFGPERDEVTGEWRKLHNDKLNDL